MSFAIINQQTNFLMKWKKIGNAAGMKTPIKGNKDSRICRKYYNQ